MDAHAMISTTQIIEVVKVARGKATIRFENGATHTVRTGESIEITSNANLDLNGPR